MMIPFIAHQIELKAQSSTEEGKTLYKAFFIDPKIKVYERYRSGVDTILMTDGFADVIITTQA